MSRLVVSQEVIEHKIETRSCPFCGSDDLIIIENYVFGVPDYSLSVKCEHCNTVGPRAGNYNNMNKRLAVEAWNKRSNI